MLVHYHTGRQTRAPAVQQTWPIKRFPDLHITLFCISHFVYSRFLTYSYLWVFNLQALACPSVLSYDWQLGSVPLVTSGLDPRLVLTGLAALVGLALLRTLVTHHSRSHRDNDGRW